jgi:hypothetical protein
MRPIERKLRTAGVLMILGLTVTILSLIWRAPLSFILFAGVGVLLTFAGIIVYLYSLVSGSAVAQ